MCATDVEENEIVRLQCATDSGKCNYGTVQLLQPQASIFAVKCFLSLIHLHRCVATTMLTMLMHQTATELAKLRST